ncbi:MAG: hypothetical protein CVV64_20225 [Candidatus Wallbacteria bacterium HGW-Wallbacteria-1]|jgi:hypothetical protein|uniref:Nitrile hydratase alpha /Thiocyanate hydrolase gamma domain-containing protein n=1 Tax=Candidatus Wallbacteria bacterium HGW-Wallbacteria-1 TaxID=2013854 RepID=A0A2N1PIG1_9BACT|nr:MAG: hypothetical protein CVV64_20225 [Candidatus Wallbacteria bacterium HGW-Wallbacteria-1]
MIHTESSEHYGAACKAEVTKNFFWREHMDQNFAQMIMTNREYRDRFIANPTAMLVEAGLPELKGKKIIAHENTGTNIYFTLIPKGVQLNTSAIDERFVRIQEKAWEDTNFKTQLLTNTRETLTKNFGDLPEHMTIGIYENTADTVHLVLPRFEDASEELNDNDLEMVSGGKGSPSIPSTPTLPYFLRPVTPGSPDTSVRPAAPNISVPHFIGW